MNKQSDLSASTRQYLHKFQRSTKIDQNRWNPEDHRTDQISKLTAWTKREVINRRDKSNLNGTDNMKNISNN
jgi:hypothetical protein